MWQIAGRWPGRAQWPEWARGGIGACELASAKSFLNSLSSLVFLRGLWLRRKSVAADVAGRSTSGRLPRPPNISTTLAPSRRDSPGAFVGRIPTRVSAEGRRSRLADGIWKNRRSVLKLLRYCNNSSRDLMRWWQAGGPFLCHAMPLFAGDAACGFLGLPSS